jgi:hypothetical protein
VEHILSEFKETKHWREKLIHDKWLNMNKEVTYREKKGNNKQNTHRTWENI